jgi:hypothetical protein
VADGWYDPIDHETLRRSLGRDLPARWLQAGGAIVFPAGGNGRLYIPDYAPVDPALMALAGLMAEPAYHSGGQPAFALYELPAQPLLPAWPAPVTFDAKISILGFDILPVAADGVVTAVSYWRVEDRLPWDLAIFTHLLAQDGSLVAQHDGFDAVPTRLYPGDLFLQLHRIALPAARPSGLYTLQMGLYTRSDGRRLLQPGAPHDYLLLYEGLNFDGK